ncbi:helix-turn-helix transcriptional regulator [Streptomyces sp. NPDC006173]|uniref:response regulator transcription factor n=1 Tax=Streptomyces sp. NPDC006173 TaxID=3155349 RepID=UPI003400F3B6
MRVSRKGEPLTARELQILEAIAHGARYAEIAAQLQLAFSSVKNYAQSVTTKLGANSLAHAVHLAWEQGLFRRERHGDHAGYAAHRYRDEEPCEACWAGERAYRAEQRQKRRQEAVSDPQGVQEAARGARDVRGAVRPSSGRTAARGEAAA